MEYINDTIIRAKNSESKIIIYGEEAFAIFKNDREEIVNKTAELAKENNIYVLEGKAVIEEEKKEGSKYYAKIKTIEEDSKFELPYVYYPGYEVRTDGIIKNYYETEHGLIGVDIEKNDEVTLEVDYVGTNIIKISAVISFISAIVFAGYIWKKS